MNQLCTTCSRRISPPSTTSPLATPSPGITVDATTALEALELELFLKGLETEYRAHQATQCSRNIEAFQSARMLNEFPTPGDFWSRSAQPSTDTYVAIDDELGYGEHCQNISTSRRPGTIETCKTQSLSVSKSEPNGTGDYRCYQHGCEGRRFSSSENYRRHIRERSNSNRTACPFCATVFTRNSNKDTHVRKGRCKGLNRWPSEQISILPNGEASPKGTYDTTDIEQALPIGGAAG